MISIVAAEVMSALGSKEEALKHLQEGTYSTQSRAMELLGERLEFAYYGMDDAERNKSLSTPLSYLEKIVIQLLANVTLDKVALKRCGLFLGSSSNDLSLALPLGQNYDGSQEEKMACARVGNGYYADYLIKHFGLSHISLSYNTACTSSANAFLDAAAMLEGGLIDYALVVGIEMFAPVTFEGFGSMQLLSPTTLKAFDKERQGIVLGEALSAVMLSRDEILSAPWHFLGGVSNCETHSVTGANPDGVGISKVILSAMKDAGVEASDLAVIKAHGTASALNDMAEINGMKLAFEKMPPFFSLKPYIGHTLGSCGSSELALLMQSVDAGFIPKSANFECEDEALGVTPLQECMVCDSGTFMLNYFGFGGNNTSLVIQKDAL